MRRSPIWLRLVAGLALFALAAGVALGVWHARASAPPLVRPATPVPSVLPTLTVELPKPMQADPDADGIKIATFLGNDSRSFYGVGPVPERLDVVWKARIGGGTTGGTGKRSAEASASGGMVTWYGTGWTGQPALVRENGRLYLLVGGFDHGLRKIDAETGRTVWRYEYDDVIKGSPAVIADPAAPDDPSRYLVMTGSRRGFPQSITAADIAPFRGVWYATGKEAWRLPVPHTRSYSRDADGSALVLGSHAIVGVESGHVYRIDPFATEPWRGHRSPRVLRQALLLGDKRSKSHGGNLVLESSPVLLGDRVYVASGAGHVYGLDAETLAVEWDFYIGSDLDGTVVATDDQKLLVPVEKQYIRGHGGVLMLDPSKPPEDAVVWFFPTGDRAFADWQGGVIGSCSVNDAYDPDGTRPRLAAFSAIDGHLYVVARDETATETVAGPNGERGLATPVLVYKDYIGGAISTPIIVDDHIVAAGYGNTVNVYRISYGSPDAGGVTAAARSGERASVRVERVARFTGGGTYESTPIVWQGRIYIGSRDGYFYCLGER
ncbi:PQQ-binding-like beta-propeller repeat protein [Coriobacteriia bacterium Es71-Z0120]|uniref:outer membrane protein assembly factor BamB family protein n=1 Tax=Parvivirga hydrogeniphila TaxID=2939460 RepID=UPI0022609E79|nr:PQQ-binding-like beta-propeller repeat protein [Parvivirga hydrogeniphila]MCL4078733.1 PQQ-binding-like beta-propeller repeat protein [Parvivirga hydrogeniphila]